MPYKGIKGEQKYRSTERLDRSEGSVSRPVRLTPEPIEGWEGPRAGVEFWREEE